MAEVAEYDTQGMALKLKEHDEALKKYATYTYPCEAHLTWCTGGSFDLEEEPDRAAKYPMTIAAEAQRRGVANFCEGKCTDEAQYRVVILDGEEKLSTGLARPMQPTLCQACAQVAIDERIFREIIPTTKADQMEQVFAKEMQEAAAKKKK